MPAGGGIGSSPARPWALTPSGRVCGAAQGTACSPSVRRTPRLSVTRSTAATKRSHWVSGSGPASRRKVAPLPSRTACISVTQPGLVVALPVIGVEHEQRPARAIVEQLVDLERSHHFGTEGVEEVVTGDAHTVARVDEAMTPRS